MPAAPSETNDLLQAIGRGWNRFWFTPADPTPCAVLRIAVGLLAVLHLAALATDLDRWYGREGLLPPATVQTLITGASDRPHYHLSYLGWLGGTELWVAHGLALAAALAFTAGLFTRASGILTLVAVLAYVHRVPQVAGHVEPVLVLLLLYLCIAQSGALLSLDCWLRRRRASFDSQRDAQPAAEPSIAANIALRLIQVHLAMFVAMMGLTKLYGDAWWDGEAIWLLIAAPHAALDLTGLRDWTYLVNFWTHAVVYYELAFPVLIWLRPARPLLLALGAVVWLSLTLVTGMWLLGPTFVLASAAFLPEPYFRLALRRRGD
jgi:hypothetical protein